MKNYGTNEVEFKTEIQIPETTDPAHADVINTPIKQLFGNTMANKKAIDRMEEAVGNKVLNFGEIIQEINAKVSEVLLKMTALENAIYYDITGNSWRLSFTNLEGVKVTKGNYNSAKKRIEC